MGLEAGAECQGQKRKLFVVGSCEWGNDYKTHALSIRNAVMNRRGSLKNCQLFVLYGLRIILNQKDVGR